MTGSIAIVGMSCLYPDARTPTELWENILAQRRAFRRLPAERFRTEDYLSDNPQEPDKTYVAEAALIEGYEFDRVAFRVVGSTFRSADLAHWVALDVASQALADAGFKNGEGLPRESTGVVLGNTLTGEFSHANLMRLRWPYVRRVLEAALIEQRWSSEQRFGFLDKLETEYKAPFPPVGEETLAGGLSNTIAGRICNQFDLKGGGYTVDGACASSLLAVANACSSLAAGDLDVALAGGVDLSLDPFEIVGFAKTGALAPQRMRVYDERSAGFWPGEGSGFVVLMRAEDAVAEGRRIYAMIRGWGISSDGSGGITRPEVDGQLQALRRAYRRAEYGVDTVEYFEGHGTGTSVGDATELKVLSRARREARPDAPVAVIGSVKANIGHTKAAAGIAGLLKATMAVHTQTLPPTTGCERPHPELTGACPALRILHEPEPWPRNRELRAAVSAMGFGGMNTHLTLESATSHRRAKLTARESCLARSVQDAEHFLFGAADLDQLVRQIENVEAFANRLSYSDLIDLAAALERHLASDTLVRADVTASTPAELKDRLLTLKSWLLDGVSSKLDFEGGVFVGSGGSAPRIGFLFPGQGSPANLSGGLYRRRFDRVRQWYGEANLPVDAEGISTDIAQPGSVTASVAGLRVLHELGLSACVGVGHSLGEITALHWAGAFDEEALLRIARVRGKAMAELGSPTGAMAAIAASAKEVDTLLENASVFIVGLNSPRQTVIAGEARAVNEVAERAQARGLRAIRISVSHAFHTPLVAAAMPVLAMQLSKESIHEPQRRIVSTITGAALKAEDDLRGLLCQQVTSPVRFIEAITTAADGVDLLIEVGPGQVLSGLASDSVQVPVVSLDAGGSSLKGLLNAAGAAYALGARLNHVALFANRFTRPFNLDWKPKFFVNPCELAPVVKNDQRKPIALAAGATPEQPDVAHGTSAFRTPHSALEVVRQLVAARAELPESAVKDDSRLLSDLHLNSITVGQLVAHAAKRLELPPPIGLTDFANATVAKIATALDELKAGGAKAVDEKQRAPFGVDSWVRSFTVEWIPTPPAKLKTHNTAGGWQVIAPASHALATLLERRFARENGCGVVVCLPPAPNEQHVGLLLQGARSILAQSGERCFVLVQEGWRLGSFARSLYLELPDVTCCVVNVPFDRLEAAEWVAHEALSADGFVEARYDANGARTEPRLKLLALDSAGCYPLGRDDVLLVTGGGKGIAAECALAVARKSGAALVLIGRSQPGSDPELAANLERMSAAELNFRYFATDVTDAEAVRATIAVAQREFGPVTALLHAAGVNVPQPVSSLDHAAFHHTLAPKIRGLQNVLAALDAEQLRVLVTFGSIIGRAGLQGEADYAVANEWQTQLTESFQAAHANCRCLAAEWSVWSNVGMGARLGRIESLRQQGITPITPEIGIETLETLLRARLPSTSVVVTGRFGELPTLTLEKPDLPFHRFLEQSMVFYPGVELIADSVLSSDTDSYVDDHVLHGEPLFPAVMGLEAMAQVAMALAGSDNPPSFENVKLSRPVVVPRAGKMAIRVAALVREPGVVDVALRSEESGFQIDHFAATCRFESDDRRAQRQIALESLTETRSEKAHGLLAPAAAIEMLKRSPIAFDVVRDLYEGLLFHTGRFRRVQEYRLLHAKECVVKVEPDADAVWFGRYLPQQRVLGDTGVRDAAIHAIQTCIPHARLLPIGVQRISVGRIPCLDEKLRASSSKPELFLHAREQWRDGDTFEYDLELLGSDGSVLERWEGLRLRKVEEITRRSPWPNALLGPYLERRLEELVPGSAVSLALAHSANLERAAATDALIRELIGADATITRRPDGKPEVAGAPSVSAAHALDITFVVAGEAPVACDLERISNRTADVWKDLLGSERFGLAERSSSETTDGFDTAATRVWTAIECLKKSGQGTQAPLVLGDIAKDGWILFSSGILTIATWAGSMLAMPDRVVIGVLTHGAGSQQRSIHRQP